MRVGPKDIRFGLFHKKRKKMTKVGYKSRREAENDTDADHVTVGYISNRRRQHHGE